MGFPSGSDGKGPTCNMEYLGWIPGLRRSPREENVPTPAFLSGKSHGQGSLGGYSPRSCIGLDINERLTLSLLYSQEGCPVQDQLQDPAWSQNWSYRKIPLSGWQEDEGAGLGRWGGGMGTLSSPLLPSPLQVWWLLSQGNQEPSPHWLLLAPQHFLLPRP